VEPDPLILIRQVARASPSAWAGLIAMLASVYLVARVVTWLGIRVVLRRWRRYRGGDWFEQARLAWPGRRLGRLSLLVVWIPLLIVAGRLGETFDLMPPIAINTLIVVAGLAGAIRATIRWGHRINPAMALTPRAEWGAWILPWSVIGPLILVVVSTTTLSPDRGDAALAMLAGVTLAFGGYWTWGWTSLMRWSGIIRPASDRLRAIVAGIAERVEIRPTAVEQVSLPMANAFAFIRTGSIGVTDAALAVLDDDELAAVCVHELAHLTEPRRVRATRLSFGFILGLLLAIPSASRPIVGSMPPEAALLLLGAFLSLLLIAGIRYVRLVHRMEVRADAMALRFEPVPGCHARALGRLYAANLVPAVLGSKRQSHPELYDRMVAAGVTPEYPRPRAPSRLRVWLGALLVYVAASAGGIGLLLMARDVPRAVLDGESAALWTIGAFGGRSSEACLLAAAARDHGDPARELAFYRVAVDLDRSQAYASAMLAGRLAQQGDCAEAQKFWVQALNRNLWRRSRPTAQHDASAIAWARQHMLRSCGHDEYGLEDIIDELERESGQIDEP
jgi:Zn-dependent protease with chaperone function